MHPRDGLARVSLPTDPHGFGGGSPERLWAKPVIAERILFEVHNSPFYAKGVSYLDVVEAASNPDCAGEFIYQRTVSTSGHSTYRILSPRESQDFLPWWKKLEKLGCTYEYADLGERLLYAVDVPPAADVHATYGILEDGEQNGIWEFDEGHCGHRTERVES